MIINIIYFGSTQESLGRAEESVSLPDEIRTVGEVLDILAARAPDYRSAFADRERLRFALDQRFVGADAKVAAGMELGIFPPVTGG